MDRKTGSYRVTTLRIHLPVLAQNTSVTDRMPVIKYKDIVRSHAVFRAVKIVAIPGAAEVACLHV